MEPGINNILFSTFRLKEALSAKSLKTRQISGFSVLLVLFGQIMPVLGPKLPYIKVKVSTDGSDEEWLHPRPTLSFTIAQFHLSCPGY